VFSDQEYLRIQRCFQQKGFLEIKDYIPVCENPLAAKDFYHFSIVAEFG